MPQQRRVYIETMTDQNVRQGVTMSKTQAEMDAGKDAYPLMIPVFSRKDEGTSAGKENARIENGVYDHDCESKTNNSYIQGAVSAPLTASSTKRKALGNIQTAHLKAEFAPQLASLTVPDTNDIPSLDDSICSTTTTAAELNKPRVLRYGETVETLFGWHENSSLDYRNACLEIIGGKSGCESKADCPETWTRVLQLSKTQAKDCDILKLHRRATSRFSTSIDQSHPHAEYILLIWLLYALATYGMGKVRDARLILRRVEHLGKLDSRYIALVARIEKGTKNRLRGSNANNDDDDDNGDDKNISKKRKSDPKKDEEIRIDLPLFQSSPENILTKRARSIQQSNIGTASLGSTTFTGKSDDILPLQLNSDTKSEKKTSELTDHIKFNLTPTRDTSDEYDRVLYSKSSGSGLSGDKRRLHEHGSEEKLVEAVNSATKSASVPQNRTPITAVKDQVQIKSTRITSTESKSQKHSRPPLMSKTPRLFRLKSGLGKARRVDPNSSISHPDSDDSDTISEFERGKDSDKSPLSKKITKVDLSYMWDWDPERRNANKDKPRAKSSCSPQLDKIEEVSSPALSVPKSTSNSILDTKLINNKANENINNDADKETNEAARSHKSRGKVTKNNTITGTTCRLDIDAMVVKANADFLPLVYEDNMLKVNGTPYVKLGVIGKGGSCKVYRALSRDCSVVAIKKVKISGMDRKAIEGYSNEIALLKQLRGNSAIIQLYDSQVDFERKAIYLVMEVGEIDLNHVLQQQQQQQQEMQDQQHSVSRDTSSNVNGAVHKRQLNMNFIRLTWQQMLHAVHCIHEERIIHGDLKPANFLFVRGSLKLIDFGIAKAMQTDDTTNIYRETQIGTLNYMSPEAILDTGTGINGARMKLGRASDIWSLGCILYQMVYGRTPFADLQMLSKLQAIVNPSYSISFPNIVDEHAIDAMRKALRRAPDERPPIVGKGGLLNEHPFLNPSTRNT